MAWLPWEDTFAVGIHVFDQQHQGLFALVNGMHEALAQGLSQAELRRVLAELIRYTLTHFRAEEVAMEGYSYPHLDEHRTEHETFASKVTEFAASYRAGDETIDASLLEFLKEWLVQHILRSDRRMSEFLSSAGLA